MSKLVKDMTPEEIERRRERARQYYEENKERARKYREANKDKIREQLKSNPNRMIATALRARGCQAFKNNWKTGSFVRDLGMSIDEFRVHIENQFDEFMSWENRGSYWQFDHIYPLNKANLRDRVEFLAVANWRNYQPLEAVENIRNEPVGVGLHGLAAGCRWRAATEGGGLPSPTASKLARPMQSGCCHGTDDLGCGRGRQRFDARCALWVCSPCLRAVRKSSA